MLYQSIVYEMLFGQLLTAVGDGVSATHFYYSIVLSQPSHLLNLNLGKNTYIIYIYNWGD